MNKGIQLNVTKKGLESDDKKEESIKMGSSKTEAEELPKPEASVKKNV